MPIPPSLLYTYVYLYQTDEADERTDTDGHGLTRRTNGPTRTDTDGNGRTRTDTDGHGRTRRTRTDTDGYGRIRTDTDGHGRTRDDTGGQTHRATDKLTQRKKGADIHTVRKRSLLPL